MSEREDEPVKSHYFPSTTESPRRKGRAKRLHTEPEDPAKGEPVSPLRRSKRTKSGDSPTVKAASEEESNKGRKRARVKRGRGRAVGGGGPENDANELEGNELDEEGLQQEVHETEITSKKARKTTKTKKADIEVSVMPLAARTNGLRMFVGAHVSAAKGWWCMKLRNGEEESNRYFLRATGVFNAVHNSVQIG